MLTFTDAPDYVPIEERPNPPSDDERMLEWLAVHKLAVTKNPAFRRVSEGGLHWVYCDGRRHVAVFNDKVSEEGAGRPVNGRMRTCDCARWGNAH